MKTQADFDREIAAMRIEHDISVYSTQILDEKRKLLEIERNSAVIKSKILDLEVRIEQKREEKAALVG